MIALLRRAWRPIVFAGNGAINTVLSWLAYVGLLHLGVGVSLAYSVSFLFGVVLSALMNLRIAFTARLSFHNVVRYAFAYAIMYLVGVALVTLLARLNIPSVWVPLLVVPAMIPLSFLVIQRLVACRVHSVGC